MTPIQIRYFKFAILERDIYQSILKFEGIIINCNYIDDQNRGKTSSYPEKNMVIVYISSTYNQLYVIN